MYHLEEINTGETCRITWLLGRIGTWLKQNLSFAEDDYITVLWHDDRNVIVKYHEKRFVFDAEVAHAITVSK